MVIYGIKYSYFASSHNTLLRELAIFNKKLKFFKISSIRPVFSEVNKQSACAVYRSLFLLQGSLKFGTLLKRHFEAFQKLFLRSRAV